MCSSKVNKTKVWSEEIKQGSANIIVQKQLHFALYYFVW